MAYIIRRGYGNSIDIPLSDSTLDIDFSSVNRAVFDLGDYQLDSDNSDHISIVPDTNALNEPVVIVKIQPGLEESIPAGDYRGELTVYDDDELSDGFVWIDEIEVSLSDKTDLEWTSDEYTIDHGNLGGLDDNDHPQYLTTTTADARYLTDASQVFPEQIGHAGEYLTTDGIAPYWNTVAGGGGGGVTDHGALTGLADDDHAQYHTDGRGDARYSALGHAHSGVYDPAGTASAAVTTHEGAADPHPTYLTATEGNAAYSALGHAHSGVYDPAGTAASAVSSHEGAVDPHPTYLTATEGNAAYSALGHTHAATEISNTPSGTIAATTIQAALNELDTEKGPYSSGFVNRTDTTLAFDAGTRVFTLTKVNNFSVYAGGKKYDYTASQTTTIANSTGLHFIYIDTDGVLKNGTSVWDIGAGTQAPVSTVYYNTTGPAVIGPFDERHSYLRNAQAHSILHNTVGAYWKSGYEGTFGDTNGSLSITAGTYYDEDIAHVSSGPLTQAKEVYRASGAWVADALSADIRKTSGGILQYDNGGTLASVTSNNFANYWVFAVNTPAPEIHVLVGQTLFTSSATAIAESITALTLPPWITAEGKLLYRITYQRTAGTPAGDIFQTPTDFRTLRLTGGSTTGNVTNGDAHDHDGGDGAQINHTTLSNIGTNTHAQIDTHLGSSSNPHSTTADQVLPSQTGNSGKFLTTNATTASWAAISASADWIYASKTTTYTVLAADKSYWLNCTNTFTLTFSAPATLGANWFCIVKNAGTGIITLAHTSGNIDGLTSYLIYPGDTRFVQCDGSTLRTVLLAGGSYTWTSGVNTFTLPPGTIRCWRDVQAGGGGGGSGRKGAAATARLGGVAGGGGARIITNIPELSVGVAIDVIVGAGGTGGASRTSNNSNGANGGVGGTSQCGTVYAYGGGNGLGGSASADYGGGGGGIAGAGTSSGNGGAPGGIGPASGDCVHMYGGGSGSGTGSNGGRSLYGGSGACSNNGGTPSGDSLFAGAAGGSGGGISSANAFIESRPGGGHGTWAFGSGGTAPQSDGSNGSNGPIPSGGGGGGYASLSTNAGNGGNGADPGGGGGGGGAAVNDTGNSGAGGTGGSGRITVWYY